MRKRFFLAALAAIMGTAVAVAQQIAVVSESGSSDLYQTLAEAIEGADPGSTIYLPGGRFAIADSVKITKKLTIIGIGHYLNGEGNEDGYTRIEGNLWFNEGSSSSAVMGCYMTGDVNIGEGDASVNDVVIRYCNLNSIQVKNSTCSETTVNQNYVRNNSNFCQSQNVTISNNIICRIEQVGSGFIRNNVVTRSGYSLYYVNNCVISDNIIKLGNYIHSGSGCTSDNNLVVGGSWGDNPIIINATDVDLFENLNGWAVSPMSNFHFKSEYSQYEHQVGIYAGSGFSDKQLAPVPYIVDKQVASETDASGKLNIKIRVKASE